MPLDSPAELYGVDANKWINVVRRARLGRTTKLVALTLASYANADGTKVFPGIARLVIQCEISHPRVRAALHNLRDAGLVERVAQGNRRRGQADEYRLTFSSDLLERINVLNPTEEAAEIARVRERQAAENAKRGAAYRQRRKAVPADQRSMVSVDDSADQRSAPSVDDSRSTLAMVSVDRPTNAHSSAGLTLATDPPPSIGPLKEIDPPSTVVAFGAQPQNAREACSRCTRIARRAPGAVINCDHRDAG